MVLDACYLAGGAPLWWVPFALAKCALWRSVLSGLTSLSRRRRVPMSLNTRYGARCFLTTQGIPEDVRGSGVLMHLVVLGAF